MEKEKQRIEELVALLKKASDAYYSDKDEIMSNFEYDALFDELVALETQTGYVLPDSPTITTGVDDDGINGDKEEHEYKALSLAKTKLISDLIKWAQNRPVWLSWKLDGLTLVLTYDNGKLSKILTRGNGKVGTNITRLKDSLFGFPKTIKYKGHLVVRGEATISYDVFDELNETLGEDEERYSNPRNLASGTLALDDATEVKRRQVWFNAFTLVHIDEKMVSWGKRMNYLEELGFNVVDRELVMPDQLEDAIARWSKIVEDGKMNIPVDGLVIAYDDTDYAATGSVTGHHATRAGYAFKWKDEEIDTTLDYIEWSCSASSINPVAVFVQVNLEGTTVSRASLCNISEIKRLGIQGKGTTVTVIKANKIIPKIVKAADPKGELVIPDRCPVCGAPTEIRKRITGERETETLHCTNPDCIAKKIRTFERFVSKAGANMDGISAKTVMKFINKKFITTYADMYKLSEHFNEIKQMDGFGEKSCKNMEKSIEKAKKINCINFIYALCIPNIGLDAAEKITAEIGFTGFLERMKNGQDYSDIKGIGPERSSSIVTWYKNPVNKETVSRLLDVVEIVENKTVVAGSIFDNMTIAITGTLNKFTRKGLTNYIKANGGKVVGDVNNKTAFLINNDKESTSSKNENAKKLGKPILSEEDFINTYVTNLEEALKY